MDTKRWNKVQNLFEEALELEEAKRPAFLKQACAGDSTLFDEVMSLLEADMNANSLLDGLALDAVDLAKEFNRVGQQFGPYRIVREIGSGGMGSVFLAERVEGEFEQKVAIKLIKHGMDSKEILKRFQSERQIMARLEHPNIARLLDGGVTPDGLSYFAMEYVDGKPIDQYCDHNKLSVKKRLELFQIICSSVQNAHRNLIVHRDLKPSNILVKKDGTIKLLDFGIAKVLTPETNGGQPKFLTLTQTGAQIMTPEYAAPEQVKGEPVTTATDVYALGVILYELLTGQRPYRLQGRSPAEIERAITTSDPDKPSTVVKRKDQASETTPEKISELRGTEPSQLKRQLSGDLDNICLMALRKEPERRYSSPERFLDDVKRYLEGLPVIARKDTAGYRTQKFIRRHKTGLVAAVGVVIMIAIVVSFYTVQLKQERDRARLEATKARRVSDFLVDLFRVSDPSESKGKTVTARELLDSGAVRIKEDLIEQPEIQATMMNVMGEVYTSLGLYGDAGF